MLRTLVVTRLLVLVAAGLAVLEAAGAAAVHSGCDLVVDPQHEATGSDRHHRSINVALAHLRRHRLRLARTLGDAELPPAATICLASGLHPVRETIQLSGWLDSNILFVGDNSTISGGVPLTSWIECNQGGYCPGMQGAWVSILKSAPVDPANLPLRHLWVDGVRASRNFVDGQLENLKTTATGYTSSTPLGAWAAAADTNKAEIRLPSQIRNWIEPRCVVSAVDAYNLTISPPCWAALTARKGGAPDVPLYIENVNQALGPGEFNADPLYIFYRPASEFPHTNPPANAVVGNKEVLLAADNVTGVSWQNVAFAYSTWQQPASPGGYVDTQTTVNNQGEPLGAVRITRARQVAFRNCSFAHLGSPYALSITNASQGVVVSGCTFSDLSGGAVKLGNVDDTRAVSNSSADMDMDYLLDNCLIEDAAVELRGAASVFAGYVANTTISRNTIRRTGYTGISLGWGWGRVFSWAKNNHVIGNSVHDVMSALNDGGCIYTLGPQPGTTIEQNHCQSDHAPVTGSLYSDNGSRGILVSNNVADTSPAPCVYLQGCCNSPAYDIHVQDLWYRGTRPPLNGCQPQNCTIDAATVHAVAATDPWPAPAQAIINSAGCSLPGCSAQASQ